MIKRTRLNDDDSHPKISSEPLIKGEETDRTVASKFYLFIPLLFDEKTFEDVLSNQIFWTSQSLNLMLSSSARLICASKECLKVRFY